MGGVPIVVVGATCREEALGRAIAHCAARPELTPGKIELEPFEPLTGERGSLPLALPSASEALGAWEALLSSTCPGCGCKSIVDGVCSKCGASKSRGRAGR